MATKSTKGTKTGSGKSTLELCDQIREVSFEMHTYLRNGHLEKVYENGLANRLRKVGLEVQQQKQLKVYDEDNTVLGNYSVDLLVEDILLVELKACKSLADEHTAQVLGYLRASKQRDAMLINFGAPKLQVKKLIL